MKSESHLLDCDFDESLELTDQGFTEDFVYVLADSDLDDDGVSGEIYFSCSVGDGMHCGKGMQKLTVRFSSADDERDEEEVPESRYSSGLSEEQCLVEQGKVSSAPAPAKEDDVSNPKADGGADPDIPAEKDEDGGAMKSPDATSGAAGSVVGGSGWVCLLLHTTLAASLLAFGRL